MKFIINYILFCLGIIGFINNATGQQRNDSLFVFSGIIYEADSSIIPLPNVNILLKKGKGMSSDVEGNFSINVSIGDTLVFSHIGFYSRLLLISDAMETKQDIYLIKHIFEMSEVMIGATYTYEEFKKKFTEMKVEYDQNLFNAQINILLCLYQAKSNAFMYWEAEDMARYSLKRLSNSVIFAGQISPENMITTGNIISHSNSLFNRKKRDEAFLTKFKQSQNQFNYVKKNFNN
ncbi:MAG: carboxypeptidase-like regulatory domain-containing protein [Vicingaceae bacterium]|nr:carboxypeptidase-like regulatory domain-containing protein [Vicingaceae bacterium]